MKYVKIPDGKITTLYNSNNTYRINNITNNDTYKVAISFTVTTSEKGVNSLSRKKIFQKCVIYCDDKNKTESVVSKLKKDTIMNVYGYEIINLYDDKNGNRKSSSVLVVKEIRNYIESDFDENYVAIN